MTFFRYPDMSGVSVPVGKSSLNASRNSESIELIWDNDSMNNDGEMPIQSLILIDVASGSFKHSPTLTITDPKLNNMQSGVENYDISYNIFQIQSYDSTSPGTIFNPDLKQNTYQEKTFNNLDFNSADPNAHLQYIEIGSSIPSIYKFQHYRYINKKLPYIFSTNYNNTEKDMPLYLKPGGEIIKYNYIAKYPTTTSTEYNMSPNIATFLQDPVNSITLNRDHQLRTSLTLQKVDQTPLGDIFAIIFEPNANKKILTLAENEIKLK